MAAAIPLVLIAGATALSAYGKVQEGQAAGNVADYNAGVARQNANLAASIGAARESAVRSQNRAALGTQASALSEAGIGLEGSAADVMRQSTINAELDALNTRYEAQLQARNFDVQATQSDYEARQARYRGYVGGATSILSGASNLYTASGANWTSKTP